MGTFRDCKGDTWEIVVDIPTVKRVRSLAGVDLLNVAINAKQASVYASMSDPVTFAEIVYAICKPEATQRGLSDEDFARRLDIDVEELAELILREIAGFFQRRNQGKAADLVLWQVEKSKQAAAKMQQQLTPEVMTKLDQEFDLMIDERIHELQETFGGTSSSLPESVESTLTPLG